jgi:hypothetical protein
METITDQLESIRDRFGTKRIFNETSKEVFTMNEIDAIIFIIKNERRDGVYEINDDIFIELEKGACHIKDVD